MSAKQHKTTTNVAAWMRSSGVHVELDGRTLNLKGPGGSVSVDVASLDESALESSERAVQLLTPLATKLGVVLVAPRRRSDLARADNFTDIAIRHTDFRRVPNPDNKQLKEHLPIVRAVAATSFRQSEKRWRRAGLLYEDLVSYASVWAISYIGLYRRQDRSDEDNRYLFVRYLRQRFSNLLDAVGTHSRRPVTREAAMVGQGYGYLPEMFDGGEVADLRYEEVKNSSRPPLSKAAAKRKLASALGEMSNDEATATLRRLSAHEDGEVAALARRMLKDYLN